MGGYGALDFRCFTKDQNIADFDVLCDSVNGSDQGDGVTVPYGANLDIMFEKMPKDLNYLPSIRLAKGSYSMSKQKSYLYHGRIPQLLCTMTYLTWPGTTTSQTATTIGAIISATRDDGICFTISAGKAPDGSTFTSLLTDDPLWLDQKFRYQNGDCAGSYAVIRKTVAPNIVYVTQVGNDFSLLPAGGNTFKYLFHDASIALTDNITFFDYLLQFRNPLVTGDYDIVQNQATLYFNNATMRVRSLNPGGGQSSLYLLNTISLKVTGSAANKLALPNGTIYTQNGCIIDGLSNDHSIQPSVWRLQGETILRKVKGINMRGSQVDKNSVDSTLRFDACENGFQEAIAYPFTYSKANLPYVAGDITTGWLANMNAVRGTQYALSGGVVTTPHGTNAMTVDGVNESYNDFRLGCHAYQCGTLGGEDRYCSTVDATPLVLASTPVPEGKVIRIQCKVSGKNSGLTKVAEYTIDYTVKRAVGGDVTFVRGGVTTDFEDDATCACTVTADVGTQSIIETVQGPVGDPMNWNRLSQTIRNVH